MLLQQAPPPAGEILQAALRQIGGRRLRELRLRRAGGWPPRQREVGQAEVRRQVACRGVEGGARHAARLRLWPERIEEGAESRVTGKADSARQQQASREDKRDGE